MSKTVHIEFIGDFICPWCYLGKMRMERVKARLLPDIELEIEVKPYVLYPNIPKGGAPKAAFVKKTKPGMGKALRKEAALENIAFNYRLIERIPYSLEAHRLVWLVSDNERKYELSKIIFHDYFEKGQDIENKEYLAKQAKNIGVGEEVIEQFLMAKTGEKEVKEYVDYCKSAFIRVVPYLRINEKFPVPGLQTVEVWEKYIRRASKLMGKP